ncbi:MAG: hypothetical protein EBQ89_10115 [Alphaproteobacteria bacterium]|nr:hypothetical protein [Alphaproteobacteria bacterium]
MTRAVAARVSVGGVMATRLATMLVAAATLFLMLALWLVSPAHAQKAKEKTPPPPPLAEKMQATGKLFYLGISEGMEAWLHVAPQSVSMFYVTPNRQAIVVGGMMGAGGKQLSETLLSKAYLENAALRQALKDVKKNPETALVDNQLLMHDFSGQPKSAQLWQALEQSFSLSVGQKGPVLYAVMTPGCQACLALWRALTPLIEADTMHMKVVLVAIPDTAEEKQAVAMMSDPSVGSTLQKMSDDERLKALRKNYMLAEQWRIQHMPFLVYRDVSGAIKLLSGPPRDMAALYADMGLKPVGEGAAP